MSAWPVENQEIMETQSLPDTMNFNSGLVDGSPGFRAFGAIKLYQQFGAGGELENQAGTAPRSARRRGNDVRRKVTIEKFQPV